MNDRRARRVTLGVVGLCIVAAGAPLVWLAATSYAQPDDVDEGPAPSSAAVPVPAPSAVAPTAVAPSAGSTSSCAIGALAGGRAAHGTSGGAVAVAPFGPMAAVVDADNDRVTVLTVREGSMQVERGFAVGHAPAQALIATDGRIFVTERGDNTLSVYDPRDGRRLCSRVIADEPFGIAIAPDERALYVTSVVSRTLTQLDPTTLATQGAVEIPREPRGAALSPDGATVYVAHAAGDPLSSVAVADGVLALRTLPTLALAQEPGALGRGVVIGRRDEALFAPSSTREASSVLGATPAAFGERTDGVLGLRPAPTRDAPLFASQAFAPVVDPQQGTVWVAFMRSRTGREVPVEMRLDRYGAGSVSPRDEKVQFALARFDPAAQTWSELRPVTSAPVRAPVAMIRRADATLVVLSQGTQRVFSFAPSNGAVEPRRLRAVSAAGSLARPRADESLERAAASPTNPVELDTPVEAGAVATGVGALPDGSLLVFSQDEHAVRWHRPGGLTVRTSLGGDALGEEISRGRRLFHAANDARITSGGLSCAGCHPDGRDDGLVWFLSHGPRQTPTLAGRMSAPFNWNGTHPTLEGNIAQTVTRLGGTGLALRDIDAIAAYLTRGLRAPERAPARETAEVLEGRRLFATTANCAVCHDANRNFTDGASHELGGLGSDERSTTFDTPSLRYLASTAPYFHDGRYPTLRALLADATHRMGNAATLAEPDVTALEAYLRTL